MLLDDGFQISEIVPGDDGSFATSLLDESGQQVGTIRRLADGTTQASVPTVETDGGYDWSKLLGKVTGFLETAASTAQGVANQATRISRGIQGATAGAKAGYTAPLDLKPWLIGGAVVAIVAIAAASSSSSRRRR